MRVNKIISLAAILVIAFLGTTSVSAQSDWKKLGEKEVSHNIDHDTITANDDDLRVRELRISVEKAPIRFTRVVLNYKDGVKQELEFLEDVQVGNFTRSINVQGDGHVIKSVDLWYETASLGGKKARVSVYGRNLTPNVNPNVSTGVTAARVNDDWKELGEKEVSFNVDHDTITANDDDLRVREIRISVKNAPVKFTRVVLNYKDGVKQELDFLEDVQVGMFTRSINVEGDGHVIKSIDFWYETASLGGKKARVTVYGRNTASPATTVSSTVPSINAIPVTGTNVVTMAPTTVRAMGEWKELGEKEVSFNVDHDTITANDDDLRIRELRISVKNAPVKFTRVVVNYKDGTRKEQAFLEDVQVGTFTRTINIEGDGHVIKSIDFWYETASLGGKKARVTVYGRG
jgi:hypothetical protein